MNRSKISQAEKNNIFANFDVDEKETVLKNLKKKIRKWTYPEQTRILRKPCTVILGATTDPNPDHFTEDPVTNLESVLNSTGEIIQMEDLDPEEENLIRKTETAETTKTITETADHQIMSRGLTPLKTSELTRTKVYLKKKLRTGLWLTVDALKWFAVKSG